jgi:hypothetical protein
MWQDMNFIFSLFVFFKFLFCSYLSSIESERIDSEKYDGITHLVEHPIQMKPPSMLKLHIINCNLFNFN